MRRVLGADPLLITVCAMPPLLAANGLFSQLAGDGALATAVGAVKDLALGVLTLRLLVAGRWRRVPPPVVWLTGAYLALGAISAVWSTSAYAAAYGFRNDFYPVLWLVVTCDVFADRDLRSRFGASCAATAAAAAVLLIVTWSRGLSWLASVHVLRPESSSPVPSTFFSSGSVRPRGFSPWEAPNIAGVALTLMLGVALLAAPARPWLKAVTAIPVVAAVALTGSRSSILGLAAMLGLLVLRVIWLRWGTRRAAAAAGLLLVAGVAGVWGYFFQSGRMLQDPSLVGHAASIGDGFHLIAQHPWGVGVGDVGQRSLTAGEGILLESSWFLIAVEATVLALAAFVLLQLVVVVRCLAAPRDAHSFVGPALVAASLASQLSLPMIQEGSFSHLFWMGLGLGLAAAVSAPGIGEAAGRTTARHVRAVRAPSTWGRSWRRAS